MDIKNYNIMLWATRPFSVMWGQGYCEYLTRYGTKFLSLVRIDSEKSSYFTDKGSFESACKRFGRDLLKKSAEFLEKYEARKKKIFEISAELSRKAGKISDKELNQIYLQYWKAVREFEPYLMFVHFTERFLEPEVKERFPEDFDVITGLSRPLDHMNMEQASLSETPSEMAKMFGYLNTYAFLGKPYDEKFFKSYKVDRKELMKKLSDIEENKKRFERFIKTVKGNDKKMCELLHGLVFIRTDRIDAWKKHSVILYPFVDYLAKKISPKMGRDEIIMMTRDEIKRLLTKGKHPPVEELIVRARSRDFMVIFTKEGIKMVEDAKLRKEILDKYAESIEIKDEVTGMPACGGAVKGIVKLYSGPASIRKGESGFVMVAKHTSPQDLPYMKKAIAIVTDEGGVTSHAAIVSRELGIPCIVGTKIGTKAFKDGDIVEVDADRGVVKKISDSLSMDIKEKIKSLKWRRWLERNFSPFVASFFTNGGKKEYFRKIGVPGVDCKAMLYQNGSWLESEEVWDDMARKSEVFLKKHSIFDVTKSLDKFYKAKKKRILVLAKQEKGYPLKQLAEIHEIMKLCTTYIWLAHGLESYYIRKLKKEVPRYIKGDIDKFIGDASFPSKKNMHSLMEEEIRKGKDPKKIVERFGWMRARDIDSEPFSEQDIKDMKKELKPAETHQKARIPKELEGLFKEVQELVFFRTARTDVYYEFMLLSRPIFKRVAGFYKIPYTGLKFYPVPSLIKGKPKKYSMDYTFACYEGSCSFFDKPLVIESETKEADSIYGMVAYKGIVKGTARVLRDVSELNKVKQGDILVTQMTFPAFLPAMARAAAFVTDEGGITCHAAIVAREMRKPCIIGTKIATKIFKDGDIVEVDADKGIVRKV